MMIKNIVTATVFLASFLSGVAERSDAAGADRGKAFFMSLLVPGLGQYYTGSPGYAKIFVAAELAVWSGYYYNTAMKQSRRQDYLTQAALHAGVNPSGRGISYLNAVGAFNSSFDSNGYQLQTRETPVLYTGNLEWKWDSEWDRQRFRDLRERELDYENNIKYCIAGALLNHLLAALHASKMAQVGATRRVAPTSPPALTVTVNGRGLSAVYSRSY
jgi:hypothetical protein